MDQHLRLYDVAGSVPNVPPYEVVRQIWRGRTADIFLALTPVRRGERKQVIVRRLRRELAEAEDFRATFFHQGRLAVRLRHPNVVETFEVRKDEDDTFMVTEFLDGQPLSRIRERPDAVIAIPLPLHLRILANVLDGLQYLHDSTEMEAPEGIVHGDVRPENVFVTYEGDVKLLHSGIESDDPATLAKESLSYIAPERARGEMPDRRSDVFSVGIMLWEAVTGLRFWQDWPESAIYRRLCSQSLPVHSKWVPIAARGLFDIAERALQVNSSDRYASAREMREAIDDALARAGDVAPTDAVRAHMQSVLASQRKDVDESAPKRARDAPQAPQAAPPSDEPAEGAADDEATLVRSGPSSVGPMSLAPFAAYLTHRGFEAHRQRAYIFLGVAAILGGGWVLNQAVMRSGAAQRVAQQPGPACASVVVSIPPPPPAASSPPTALESETARAPKAATSADVRPAVPWKPPRWKRPRVEDPWGI